MQGKAEMTTNMSTSHEAARDAECSTTIRYLLVSLLVFCALGVLLFGAVAAHSAAALRRPRQRVAPPSPAGILHRSPAVAAQANDLLRKDELDADSALGAEAVVSENLAPSTGYTIDVRLADGSEQFIAITAPPGGLELQVRDMTGDSIQNDLVVRPALTHWPLIVLLNDGHNHFTVAISATLPSSVDSGSRLSRSRQISDGAALVSFASKAGSSASGRQFLVPRLQQGFLSSFTQSSTNQTDRISVSGRAPPAKI
jgi:hypothetical protein